MDTIEFFNQIGIYLEIIAARSAEFYASYMGNKMYHFEFLITIYRSLVAGCATLTWHGQRYPLYNLYTLDSKAIYCVTVIITNGGKSMLPMTIAFAAVLNHHSLLMGFRLTPTEGQNLSLIQCAEHVVSEQSYVFNVKMWLQILNIPAILEENNKEGLNAYISPNKPVPPTPAPKSNLEEIFGQYIVKQTKWQDQLTNQVTTNTAGIQQNRGDIGRNRNNINNHKDRIAALESVFASHTNAPRKAPCNPPAFTIPRVGRRSGRQLYIIRY